MPTRPDIIDREEAEDPGVRAHLAAAESSWYGDAAFFGAMAHSPEIFKRIVDVFDDFGQGEHVNTELLELMRLKIAEVHQCAYCATVRTLEVREAVASKEDAVFGSVDAEKLTRREYLAVKLAEQLAEDPHRFRDDHFEELQEVFNESELIELLLFASLEVGLDRFCIALELQPTAESEYPTDVEYPLEDPRPRTE